MTTKTCKKCKTIVDINFPFDTTFNCTHDWQEPEHLGPKMVAIGEDTNIGLIPDYTEPLSNSLDMSLPLESQLEKIIEYYANRCEQITNQLHNKEPKVPIKFIVEEELPKPIFGHVSAGQFFVSEDGKHLYQKSIEGHGNMIATFDGTPFSQSTEFAYDDPIERILSKIKKIEF